MAENIEANFEFFLKKDFEEFEDGEWLAICGKKIIAHTKDLKKVMSDSKNCKERPLFTRVKKSAFYLK